MELNPMMTGRMAYDASKAASSTDELARKAMSSEDSELREVCDDFEALFVKMMLDEMRKTLSDDTLIPKNQGEKLFEDELYTEYAESISKTANLGLSDMMYDQLAAGIPGEKLDISL